MPRLAALLTATLLVALPATPALAQSAGDEQYSDPFAESTEQTTPAAPAPAPGPAPAQQAPAAPAPSAPETGDAAAATGDPAAAAQGAAPAATAAGGAELPRTGLDGWKPAVAGLALVLLGIGLRARTADARP